MKIIEIIGLAGAGKSTALKLLYQNRSKNNETIKWCTNGEALRMIAKHNALQSDKLSGYLYCGLMKMKGFERVLVHSFNYKHKRNLFLNDWSIKNRIFLTHCLNITGDTAVHDIGKKYHRLCWLLNTAENVALIEKWPSTELVLYDESLIQKTIYLLLDAGTDPGIAVRLFHHTPVPSGVIYFRLDPDLSVERLMNRRMAAKANYRTEEQESIIKEARYAHTLFENIIKYLDIQGVPLLKIDASKPSNEQVEVVEKYIMQMHENT